MKNQFKKAFPYVMFLTAWAVIFAAVLLVLDFVSAVGGVFRDTDFCGRPVGCGCVGRDRTPLHVLYDKYLPLDQKM